MAFHYPSEILQLDEELQAKVKEILAKELPAIVSRNKTSKLFISFSLRGVLNRYRSEGDGLAEAAANAIETYILPLSLKDFVSLSEELKSYKPEKSGGSKQKFSNAAGVYERVIASENGTLFTLFDDKNINRKFKKLYSMHYQDKEYALLIPIINSKEETPRWYRYEKGPTPEEDEMVPVQGVLINAMLDEAYKK